MTKYLFLALISASTLSSCFLVEGKRVRGDGNIATDERSVGAFDGVESLGSFDIVISPGQTNSLTIEADENLMEFIETDVRDGILSIRTRNRHSIRPSRTITCKVVAPTFRLVRISGSGNVKSNGHITSNEAMEISTSGSGSIDLRVTAPSINADISGSGDITLAGEAAAMASSIAGSGDLRAGELKTRQATVRISGSGNTSIHADESLDVSIAGSGEVNYSGNAKVTSHVAGSGSINKTD
jgi:hypothetical protein